MAVSSLEPITNFAARFLPKRFKTKQNYRQCVLEALEEAVKQYGNEDLPDGNSKLEKQKRTKMLISWAKSGFQNSGEVSDLDISLNESGCDSVLGLHILLFYSIS